MSIAVIAAVVADPALRSRRGAAPATHRRPTRFIAASRRALITGTEGAIEIVRSGNVRVIAGAIGYWAFDNAVLWATFHAFGYTPEISIVLMGYLIGQLGGLLPIPGGIGGIDGGLIGTLIVYGAPAAIVAAAVLAYRVILFWLPLIVGGVAFFSLRRDMPRDGELGTLRGRRARRRKPAPGCEPGRNLPRCGPLAVLLPLRVLLAGSRRRRRRRAASGSSSKRTSVSPEAPALRRQARDPTLHYGFAASRPVDLRIEVREGEERQRRPRLHASATRDPGSA